MKNYVREGKIYPYAHTAAVVSGQCILIGKLVGVACADYAANTTGQYEIKPEVYTLPKATGQAWTDGCQLYWDDTNKVFTTTVGSNTPAGKAMAPAASGDATGAVKINT